MSDDSESWQEFISKEEAAAGNTDNPHSEKAGTQNTGGDDALSVLIPIAIPLITEVMNTNHKHKMEILDRDIADDRERRKQLLIVASCITAIFLMFSAVMIFKYDDHGTISAIVKDALTYGIGVLTGSGLHSAWMSRRSARGE